MYGDRKLNNKYRVNFNVILGEGAFAKVFEGHNRQTKKKVAVKEFVMNDKASRDDVTAEVNALVKLNHNNIVNCLDHYDAETRYYVVMEYIEGGHTLTDLFLDDKLRGKSMDHIGLTEFQIRHIFIQLQSALYHAYSNNICHRDVKLDNILVRNWETFDVVLADFNFSKELDSSNAIMKTRLGTPGFKAPEIISSKKYNYRCDIWSLGVLTYCLFSWGFPPFATEENTSSIAAYEATFRNIKKLRLEFYPKAQFNNASPEARKLLRGMLTVNPSKRYSYKKIRNTDFYKGKMKFTKDFNFNPKIRAKEV